MATSLKTSSRRLIFCLKKVSFLAFNPKRKFREKLRTVVKLMYQNSRKLKTLRVSFSKPQAKLKFSGWGMTSNHQPPWKTRDNSDFLATSFSATNESLLKILRDNQFVLSQFKKDGQYQEEIGSKLSYLSWRHFIVFWSASYSAKSANQN